MKTFVLFGSTGDLATRYVLPALGVLLKKGVYQHLVCVGRRDWSRDDFRNFLAPFPDLLNHTETISYVKLDIEGGDFTALKEELENIHALKGEVTYHLCLSPDYFISVAKGLASAGLNNPESRIMIEKPFGHDLKSAIALNLELQNYFSEDHIYRVDHYLGKNYVCEMKEFRLSQRDDWYSERISEISVIARETLQMEGRGEYYDKTGATRDFLQNHLLQILALATMQTPHSEDQNDVRDRIAQAISSVAPLLIDPRHDVVFGQYEGYKSEPGVDPKSRTETYIHAHLTIDHPLWKGTDVILETGKALDRKESSVKFVFRDGSEKVFSENTDNKNNSYEKLISKALSRDAAYFVRWDSVRAAWQVVDDLLHCTDNCPILKYYQPGTKEV